MSILIDGPVASARRLPRRWRAALAAATALAGLFGVADAMSHEALAQGVKLAPLGSHAAPSEAVPVYAGADLGQDAPNPLVIPPPLTRAQTPSPVAPPAAEPAPVVPPDPVPAEDTPPPPTAQLAPLPPAQPISPPVVPPTRIATPRRSSVTPAASSADDLNNQQLQALPATPAQPRPALTSRQPVVAPGSAPVYPGATVLAQAYTPRASLPPEYLYQAPAARGGQLSSAQTAPAGATPLPYDDGPLLTNPGALPASSSAPLGVAAAAPVSPGAASYSPSRPAQVPVGYNSPTGVVSQSPTAPGFGTAGYDPVTQEIDRNIRELRAAVAPSVQIGADYLGHSGESGLSKLNTYMEPIEATFSPAGVGQLKLAVTPVELYAGTLGGGDSNFQRFGTMARGIAPGYTTSTGPFQFVYHPPAYSGPRAPAQTASGTALDLRYTFGFTSVDFGTTPLGFRVNHPVGGIEVAPSLTDNVRLRLTLQRRAVSESFLSYAGTTDPYSGKTWGGVVRSEGKASLESSIGPWNLYAGGGVGELTGKHVKSNQAYEVGAGATYPVFTGDREELRLGVDLHYSHFDRNLRFFTYGQGGYFSPQRFLTAVVPITYHNASDPDISYDLDGSVGYQQFSDTRSTYYPIDPVLQAQLVTQSQSNSLISTSYAGTRSSGIAGGISGQINVRITDSLSFGAKGSFLQSGDYQQYGGGLFARYVFNGFEVR